MQDYSSQDLYHIAKSAAKAKGWDFGYTELRAVVSVLDKQRRKPNFGNAGAVNNLLSAAATRMEARLSKAGMSATERATAQPTVEDILAPEDLQPGNPEDIFADLIGCKQVGRCGAHVTCRAWHTCRRACSRCDATPYKDTYVCVCVCVCRVLCVCVRVCLCVLQVLDKLREWQATIQASQKLGRDPLDSFEMNFLFVGSPGKAWLHGKPHAHRQGARYGASGLHTGLSISIGSVCVSCCLACRHWQDHRGQACWHAVP